MNNPKFCVGDKAILVGLVGDWTHYNGTVVTVSDPLDFHITPKIQHYGIRHSSGGEGRVLAQHLKPLPPEKTVSWDECVFQPTGLGVTA